MRRVRMTGFLIVWMPLLPAFAGCSLSGDMSHEVHYTVVPGELLVPRQTIRAAQEMTAEETKNLITAAAQNQTKYVQFDFEIGGID